MKCFKDLAISVIFQVQWKNCDIHFNKSCQRLMFICCQLTLDWQSVFDKVYTLWILPILFPRLHNNKNNIHPFCCFHLTQYDSIRAFFLLHPWHHKWENWSGLLWLSNYCDGNGGYDGIENCKANNNNDDYDDDDDIYWRDNWSDRLWESDSSLLLPPMEKTIVSGFPFLNPCLIWFNLLMKEDIM